MGYKIDLNAEIRTGLLLLFMLLIAIILANTELLAKEYNKIIEHKFIFNFYNFSYTASTINIINDGLMTLFFLLIGLELKYHLTIGEYSDRTKLLLPTIAAIGGIVGPATIYIYLNYHGSTLNGWAIPIATDTAFMLGILAFFQKNLPLKLRAFIISFSLIDDALALMILAIFYTPYIDLAPLIIAIILLIIIILLNYYNIKHYAYYLIVGTLLWVAMVCAEIHGTLCGALLGLMIPIQTNHKINPYFKKLEHLLKPIVNYCILPLFIFVNSGIKFNDLFNIHLDCKNLTFGIILGLFLGKQLGIYTFSAIAIKFCGHCKLPSKVTWLQFYAIAVLGGIGFTLSLFIGGLTFTPGTCQYYSMKNAVIVGSILSAIVGAILLACNKTASIKEE